MANSFAIMSRNISSRPLQQLLEGLLRRMLQRYQCLVENILNTFAREKDVAPR